MPANTDLADVNEIYVGFLLAKKKWFDPAAKQQFELKSKKIGAQQTAIQIARAEVMVAEFLRWAKAHGYSGVVREVAWTARPGVLQKFVKRQVDSKKNPSDIVVKFTSGPADGLLGLSAKSTGGSGDIGFKNPGIGTVETSLKINLGAIATEETAKAISKFKLPESSSARKEFIRANPKIQAQTQQIGSTLLSKIRDVMYEKLKRLSGPQLKDYLLKNWLDASNDLYPPYVKVTGMGNDIKNIKAKVDDPLANEKLSAILQGRLMVEKVGNEAVGVTASGKKILKMRAKFESEKLASTIKFSGDPW